jgi:beta-N-acetylhexosaminidase
MKKMIRHLFSLIIITCFSLFPPLLTPTNLMDDNNFEVTAPAVSQTYSVFNLTSDEKVWVDSVLDRMTIRERVAQMIMPWAGGNYTSETSSEFKRIKYLVEDLKVGGLIFFKGDILNEALLINKVQSISQVPLLISSDFERGLAMRLTDATEFPYNMALAATGDTRLASEMGRIISLESRAIGIHQNYAPVADINTNADNPIINIRAYSEDKNIVSDYCQAFISGTVRGKMIATVKHFPGHGGTMTDSHKELPVINSTREELMQNDLIPFINAINSGVHSVMIGHLSVPSLEPGKKPATLSKNIITGLLKEELGFQGLIVTDAMNMNAVTKNYSVAEASVLAVKAGNDIILMPPDEAIAITAISDAVHNGEISIERINESVRKILSAKKWVDLDKINKTDISMLPAFVGSKKIFSWRVK